MLRISRDAGAAFMLKKDNIAIRAGAAFMPIKVTETKRSRARSRARAGAALPLHKRITAAEQLFMYNTSCGLRMWL